MRTALFAPALLALSACMAAPPESPTAVPGNTPVDPAVAAQLFAETCLATLPDHAGVPAVLAARPFTRNAATGTYYHDTLNLSFAQRGSSCSMVFLTTDANPEDRFLAGARAANVPARGQADFSTGPAPPPFDGQTVVRVRIN